MALALTINERYDEGIEYYDIVINMNPGMSI